MSNLETSKGEIIPKKVPRIKEGRYGDYWEFVGAVNYAFWRTQEGNIERTDEVCQKRDEVVLEAHGYRRLEPIIEKDESGEEMIIRWQEEDAWNNFVVGEVTAIYEYIQKNPQLIYLSPDRNFLLEIEMNSGAAEISIMRFLHGDKSHYSDERGEISLHLYFPRTGKRF